MAPPAGFSDLYTAYNSSASSFHNVIGVVVDLMATTTTRTGEYMITFKLLDPRLRDAVNGSQGITVRSFKKDQLHLPRVRQLGDIVLLRNIKAAPFQQQPLLLSSYQTAAVVFPYDSIPDPTFQIAFQGNQRVECLGVPLDKERVSLEEQAYVIALKHDMKDTVEALPASNLLSSASARYGDMEQPAAKRPRLSEPTPSSHAPPNGPLGPVAGSARKSDVLPQPAARQTTSSTFGRKFKLIKDLAHRDFADICAQIVKQFPLPYGGIDLYITDYTPNESVFYHAPPEQDTDTSRDGDEFGYAGGPPKRQFPGPYEWNVLKVNVKDPHAHFLTHAVRENDFVLLRNVKMKMRDGFQLEGDMWPDNINPEKVQVQKLTHHGTQEIQDLLLRKEKYWAARKTKVEQQENAKLTKPEKRAKKKKQIAERKAAQAEAMDALLKDQQQNANTKTKTNPHVRCSNDEVPITSLKDILDPDNARHTYAAPGGGPTHIIPFVNAKYRVRARVVDFLPRKLEDFAVPASPHEEGDADADVMDWQLLQSQRWDWAFALLIEDASNPHIAKGEKERLWVTFQHEDAQFLLGNAVEDPGDLRRAKGLLGRLREKMCILWGDLEEVKGRRRDQGNDGEGEEEGGGGEVSNLPFECCVMEYGVRVEEDEDEDREGMNGGREDGEDWGRGLGYRRMYAAGGVTIL